MAIVAGKRRRRSADEARSEILAAASALLREQAVETVTVSAIMSRTTLSRKSFYVYFPDRVALLRELLAPLRAETDAAIARWRTAPDPRAAARAALESAARMYQRDGAVLRTLAAASQRDAEAAQLWREFLAPLEQAAAETIAHADDRLPASATARALVTMNVHHLLDEAVDAAPETVDIAVETLAAIWERTLYPHD
ncbi:TetR/AcrR family transcriptional regulator [Nocardia beijingensis]|uniref:TetR/AcrR family transcriptional regulator n=1 Tax=Nocardia beijingensis TaxID=95162 RepID=UPI0018931E7A|nr:TetR/AcrR family transcriptional regulator [Nocardia beijingensis]MBF6076603.1 TetR/AcrR family transcriptional regulator [Nocardia beijingensis]